MRSTTCLIVRYDLGHRLPISRNDNGCSGGYSIQDLVDMATSPCGGHELSLCHFGCFQDELCGVRSQRLLVIELFAGPGHNVISGTLAELRQELVANGLGAGIGIVCWHEPGDCVAMTCNVIDRSMPYSTQERRKSAICFRGRNDLDHR